MYLRNYNSTDCKNLAELFYDTVHSANAKDYAKEALDVWATEKIDLKEWNRSFIRHHTVVAVENNVIVGFDDIDNSGYLDRLFVHKNYQRQGITTTICNELESAVTVTRITTHASITAKPFFQQRDYKIVKKQEIIRRGVILTNYLMEKLKRDKDFSYDKKITKSRYR